jgi:hypothetical protein
MSNYELEEDEFEFDSNDVLGQLRKANKAKEKQLKEIQEELSNLRKEKRERTISEVLTARGVNPKISAFIPQDIDLTEESLSSWLNEYGDVFGVSQTNQSNPAIPEGFVDNYRKAQETLETGISADRQQMIEAQMAEAATKGPEALKQLFSELGKAGY